MIDYSLGPINYGALTMHKRDAVGRGADELRIGRRVLVRDAYNELLRAEIIPVPADWQDASRERVWTVRGAFPKCWVKLLPSHRRVPWPLSDVFTDLATAQAVQSEYAAQL